MSRSELTFNYGLIVHSVERQPFTDLISNALKDRGVFVTHAGDGAALSQIEKEDDLIVSSRQSGPQD